MSNETEDSTDFSEVTAELAKAQDQSKKYSNQAKYTKVNWGKVPYGDTKIMILKGRPLFVEVLVHHNYYDSQNNKRAYLCAKAKYGTCPGCDKVAEYKASGNVKEEIAKKAALTYLYNGVDASGASVTFGLKKSQHTEVLQEINALRNDEGIDATEPSNNVQIKITRMKVTPYARARAVKNKEKLSAERTAELLAARRDLTAIYMDLTPALWNDILVGKDVIPVASAEASEDDSDKVEAKPAAKKEAPKAASKPAPAKKVAPVTETTEDGTEYETETGEIVEASSSGGDADLERIQKLLES